MLTGIWGKPFIDLEPFVDLRGLSALDREICHGLIKLAPEYTGGSHKSMGIVPPSLADDPFADYGQVIRKMSREELIELVSLSDDPTSVDIDSRDELEFGEERDIPLNHRQMMFLKYRYGVYFPWKVYVELMPGGRWDDKSNPEGKRFTREAMKWFPRTVAFIRALPFAYLGSVKLLGLEANDHGTVHRDADPAIKTKVDHFMTLCPRGNKRLFVWDEEQQEKTFVDRRAYWFNDSDYHGVEPSPFFRYSIRVDGAFKPAFYELLRERHEQATLAAR